MCEKNDVTPMFSKADFISLWSPIPNDGERFLFSISLKPPDYFKPLFPKESQQKCKKVDQGP